MALQGGVSPKTPLDIHYMPEPSDLLVINGIKFSGDLFRTLCFPRTDRAYRFERKDSVVTVTDLGPVEAQQEETP